MPLMRSIICVRPIWAAIPHSPAGIGAAIASTTQSAGTVLPPGSIAQSLGLQLPKIIDTGGAVIDKEVND
jgi:hypothetical protein